MVGVAVGKDVGVGVPGSTFHVGVGIGINVELGTWNIAVGIGPQLARSKAKAVRSRRVWLCFMGASGVRESGNQGIRQSDNP